VLVLGTEVGGSAQTLVAAKTSAPGKVTAANQKQQHRLAVQIDV
jgi:hypothetical protein